MSFQCFLKKRSWNLSSKLSKPLNVTKRKNLPPLPEEIWRQIFAYLDFKSLQKVATVVCSDWLEIIRKDSDLSGHLLVSQKGLDVSDINLVLRNWPALRVIELSKEVEVDDLNFSTCPLMKKVIFHWTSGSLGFNYHLKIASNMKGKYVCLIDLFNIVEI